MKSRNDIEQSVSSVCTRHKGIVAAYIFGSFAKGQKEKPGDIDIAVLLEQTCLQSFEIPSLISEFEKVVDCRVDVVVLNRADEILKYEVRRSGKLIFERSPEMRKMAEIRGRKSYEDFLNLHNRYVRKVLYGGKNG
jgi:predicted nucleotidyltransferase